MMTWDPDIKTCWIDITRVGFGVEVYTCFSKGHFAPIGTAWIHASIDTIAKKNTADLLDIYVVKYARRTGVASLLIQEILKYYKVIFTSSGSKEGGKKFIESAGFKYMKSLHVWVLKKGR